MAKLKIYGKSEPSVGIKEYYSIYDLFGSSTPVQLAGPNFQNIPDDQIKWSVWILLGGSWIKTEENNKTGATVEYTFSPKSLKRKGIRMLVDINGEKAVLDIKTKQAVESKIMFVELLDINKKKPTQLFKYGQTIIARVHCVNMEKFPISVTLWEDDGGKGKENATDIKIDEQKGNVLDGIVDVEFYLDPAQAWLANIKPDANAANEGAFHEYYVTAEFYKKVSKPSKNVDVINPDYKDDPYAQNSKPETKKETQTPAEKKGPSQKEQKGIAKSDRKAYDYAEKKVAVEPVVGFNPAQEFINSMMMVNVGDAIWNKEKGVCFCNKNFEEKDVRKLVKLLKGSETIWEGQALRRGGRVPCNINDKSFATLTKSLNESFKRYKINTCIQKIHFLAQVCEETGTFTLSEEIRGEFISSQSVYKGRGLLQLTGVRIDPDDARSHFDKPGPYQDYADYRGNQEIVTKPEIVANNVDYCIDSGAWIWSINKKMTSNPRSQAITIWGRETLGKSLNELAVFGEKYFELISVLLNGRGSNGMPNNYAKRQTNYNLLKTFFFMYDKYHGASSRPFNAKDIVTYHIYENGDIEKHIPKEIKDEYKDKYKYVYHDKSNNEHEICTVKWFMVDKRNNGTIISSIPQGHIHTYNYPSGGNAQVAYVYANGDVCVSGTTYGYRKYPKGEGKVPLLRMMDNLSYEKDDVKIFYSFRSSQRRYCNPDAYAGFIGALAKLGREDVLCTGMCFDDATSYPSVTHPNGDCADTAYYSTLSLEQKKVNAFKDFHFEKIYRGSGSWYSSLVGTIYSSGHEDHLHSGEFNLNVVKIIKE
ncbi:hypothetical protein [Flavobacterium ginsengiterrae]|uniref:Chitinase n=1 Tax=Flavobacterium ginsengiterrae TaxID=871695 RepID=A0ABP7GPC5_9FLAO